MDTQSTDQVQADPGYAMLISPMTVDKLGVKLYDKVSAVVAELIANSYDADAKEVTVWLPLDTMLVRIQNGVLIDDGLEIVVEDNGHGMTPAEASSYFLVVGSDRRRRSQHGATSRAGRRVMGRKGIGKLAPFGICRRIEVISAGGEKTKDGYLVAHFVMDYDDIMRHPDDGTPVPLTRGDKDRTYRPEHGTTIRLSSFLRKRIPNAETFLRQMAQRFQPLPSFTVQIGDTTGGDNLRCCYELSTLDVPVREGTRIDLSGRPVPMDNGIYLHVDGWVGMAEDPYRNEEMAGVRIYARHKIVAVTRDFEQPAGFTGEFAIRSYLVGEISAEWLDDDEGEDLVRSDRQGIIWESERGRALRSWGAELIKEVGRASQGPRRASTAQTFLENSKFEERARSRYRNQDIQREAIALAKKFGSFAAGDELNSEDYLNDLSEFILTVAPHQVLVDSLRNFARQLNNGADDPDEMAELFNTANVAEMASYVQIARGRVEAIKQLQELTKRMKVDESLLQTLIEDAPWLIEPTWTVITKNQWLSTFVTKFEAWYSDHYDGQTISLSLGTSQRNKRPDFTAVQIGQKLRLVEIKAKGHIFGDADWDRMVNYVEAFDRFFQDNPETVSAFPRGWQIDLIADDAHLDSFQSKRVYRQEEEAGRIVRSTWIDFLTRAETAHEAFLASAGLGSESHNG